MAAQKAAKRKKPNIKKSLKKLKNVAKELEGVRANVQDYMNWNEKNPVLSKIPMV